MVKSRAHPLCVVIFSHRIQQRRYIKISLKIILTLNNVSFNSNTSDLACKMPSSPVIPSFFN